MHNNVSVENNFIGGLKTEFTGLNFPENACTAASNCVFSIIGDVLRREGIDYEANFTLNNVVTANSAVNYYKWRNAGGDGASEIVVVQVGGNLYFFYSSRATPASPLSAQMLTPTIMLSTYLPSGSSANPNITECQFSDGNGFLFVFHPNLDPFYVQFTPPPSGPALISAKIDVQIRDFFGIAPEPGNPMVNQRPSTLTNEHNYNLQNQGWTNASTWSGTSSGSGSPPAPLTTTSNSMTLPNGSTNFTIQTGLTIVNGTAVNVSWSDGAVYQASGDGNYFTTAHGTANGTVTSYTSGTGALTLNITSSTTFNLGSGGSWVSFGTSQFTITSSNLINTITTWNTQVGNYPSNADIWFTYITPDILNTTSSPTSAPGIFSPTAMLPVVPLSVTQAPQGHFILNAFNQDRTSASGVPSITTITTLVRPRAGCWFQGRVWYAGVDGAQPATGDVPYYTWTENIYFSQIVSSTTDFGACYQNNDPTNNKLFDLLPTDGGVIVIQGSGPIYKLFPIQNGLLVFAANGVWLIRGNSGLGFTANDYSINKISAVKAISSTSYVDVNGLPFFWNLEGIYRVAPAQAGAPYGLQGFEVEPLTVGTILSFYNNIPLDSKRYARGSYDPISYVLTWVYRSTQESGIANRYQFDSALNLNAFNRAFYPYTFPSNGLNTVNGVLYVDYPSGSIIPTFKYLTSTATQLTFAEEKDNVNWVDWFSTPASVNYTSSFTTGYKLHGQGIRKFMPIYLYMFTRNTVPSSGYNIQATWDYAINTDTGKISANQIVSNPPGTIFMDSGIPYPTFGNTTGNKFYVSPLGQSYIAPDGFSHYVTSTGGVSDIRYSNFQRRHKIRGHGQVLQLQVTSITGQPFEILGWTIPEQINVSA